MSWPPSAPSVGYIAEGYTTIVWGTDGFAFRPGGSGGLYIVKSCRPSERVDAPIIENGSGLTATQILIIDGYDHEITVVDDTTITAPVAGTILTLNTPFFANAQQFLTINSSYNASRKVEGERVLLCKMYTLFVPV